MQRIGSYAGDCKPRPKLVLYYESGNRDYSKAANTIKASIGKFTEVTLLYLFCVTALVTICGSP